MSILTQVASREEFIQSVFKKSNSYNSRDMAVNAFKKWDKFLNGQNESELIQDLKNMKDSPEMYTFLNRFVQFMVTEGMSKNTTVNYFNKIKGWLRFNAIRVHNDDVKQFVTFPKQNKEMKRPLTMEQIREVLKHITSHKMRALVFTLASSGMRLNEALQLRYQDIHGGVVRLRAHTTKTRVEREARISKEAIEAIQIFRNGKQDHEFIFVSEWTPYCDSLFETLFRNARRKAGYNEKYDNGKMYVVNLHAFRAFFNTTATRILGDGMAHALIGHGAYLGQYTRLTDQEKTELYEKLEPHVTISNEVRLKAKNSKLEEKLAEQDQMKLEVQKMQDEIKRLQNRQNKHE